MTKYTALKSKLNFNLAGEGDDAFASITHYLQTYGDPAAGSYERDAVRALRERLAETAELSARGTDESAFKELMQPYLPVEWDVPFPPPVQPEFTFIDLFAGIGGFRLAFQELGGKCVFSSEIDPYARRTYELNFGEVPFGDITKIDEKTIPDHDILLAGFPCQAFSIAGRRGGFNDTRGTLFFDIARILKEKRPRAFFLENVKGLTHHDRGRTFNTIMNVLREELGYHVPEPQIINAKDYGVPQNRERIYIVGFELPVHADRFQYPKPTDSNRTIWDIMEKKPVDARYYMSTVYLQTLREHRSRHEAKGNGFGFEIRRKDQVANAIVVGGMGRERNLIVDDRIEDYTPTTHIKGEINRENVRRMTPREWASLQGFPGTYRIKGIADVHLYKQFGNSVAVPAIRETGKQLLQAMEMDYDAR